MAGWAGQTLVHVFFTGLVVAVGAGGTWILVQIATSRAIVPLGADLRHRCFFSAGVPDRTGLAVRNTSSVQFVVEGADGARDHSFSLRAVASHRTRHELEISSAFHAVVPGWACLASGGVCGALMRAVCSGRALRLHAILAPATLGTTVFPFVAVAALLRTQISVRTRLASSLTPATCCFVRAHLNVRFICFDAIAGRHG